MIIEYNGDLLDANMDIIAHQVNCKGAMGAGIAKQIHAKYPKVAREYKGFLNKTPDSEILGQCQIVSVNDGNKWVANLFGQYGYGRDRRHTNYEVLEIAMTKLKDYAKERNLTVGLPYGIGCGLAGGDWEIVRGIIERVFADYEVYIVKL